MQITTARFQPMKDCNGLALKIGRIYAVQYTDQNGPGQHGYGPLVEYVGEGDFVDADDAESYITPDGDTLVPQL